MTFTGIDTESLQNNLNLSSFGTAILQIGGPSSYAAGKPRRKKRILKRLSKQQFCLLFQLNACVCPILIRQFHLCDPFLILTPNKTFFNRKITQGIGLNRTNFLSPITWF